MKYAITDKWMIRRYFKVGGIVGPTKYHIRELAQLTG